MNIAYRSTNGSDLCFEWKEHLTTNYTMFYKMPGLQSDTDDDEYKPCSEVKRQHSSVAECCTDHHNTTSVIEVRIDYENKYIKVYGIKYILKPKTIVDDDLDLVQEECESDLKLTATSYYEFKWNEYTVTKFVLSNISSWFLRLNDTEAEFSMEYGVKCQNECIHCNIESNRPEPPRNITYRSTTGSDLCFEWKEDPSTNYTMFYKMPAFYSVNDFQDYKPCTNTVRNSGVAKCCPDDLQDTGMIGVRIDYENEYIKVYGIKYILRASTIAIPNPVKSITYELNDTTCRLSFEDPDDWNSYSFSTILDKRVCQTLPPAVNGDNCKIVTRLRKNKNEYEVDDLNYNTTYTFSVETFYIENRWSEPKYVKFQTNPKKDIFSGSSQRPLNIDFLHTKDIFSGSGETEDMTFVTSGLVTTHHNTVWGINKEMPKTRRINEQQRSTGFPRSGETEDMTSVTSDLVKTHDNTVLHSILMVLGGMLIIAIGILITYCSRWTFNKLFWKIPEPNIPKMFNYHDVMNIINREPEEFDELKKRQDELLSSCTDNVPGTASCDVILGDVNKEATCIDIGDSCDNGGIVFDNREYTEFMGVHFPVQYSSCDSDDVNECCVKDEPHCNGNVGTVYDNRVYTAFMGVHFPVKYDSCGNSVSEDDDVNESCVNCAHNDDDTSTESINYAHLHSSLLVDDDDDDVYEHDDHDHDNADGVDENSNNPDYVNNNNTTAHLHSSLLDDVDDDDDHDYDGVDERSSTNPDYVNNNNATKSSCIKSFRSLPSSKVYENKEYTLVMTN